MITQFEKYLSKQNQQFNLTIKPPEASLKLIITIPAYNEPNILETLESIKQAELPMHSAEVIILINHSEHSPKSIKKQNEKTKREVEDWASLNSTKTLRFHTILISDFPKKHAGVGLARKLAMDEAIKRFNSINQELGIICSLDADTVVQENYLSEIEYQFLSNKKLNLVIPSFEHRLTENAELNLAIMLYELHLRYFKLALASTGFPYAYHTIGSAFAVSANAYVKQGGMNKKQGGEDFYFLHKIFQLKETLELNQVKVFPSSRPSDRVPFGTGPAVSKIIQESTFLSYKPEYFTYLKTFFDKISILYKADSDSISKYYSELHFSIKDFITINEFTDRITEIKNNSSNETYFKHRFFSWFDAFKIIKYLNTVHLSNHRIDIREAITVFFDSQQITHSPKANIEELLNQAKNAELST